MPFSHRFPFAGGGLLLAALVLVALASASPRGTSAAAIIVTSTNDSGAGSLREAITISNANGVPDTISFDIGGCPPACTIGLASALPNLSDDETTIDGATQPGYAGTPLVVLDGSGAGASADGIRTTSGVDGATVLGLAFEDFNLGISLCVSNGATAQDNRVSGSETYGISVCGEDIAVLDNVVEDSGIHGIDTTAADGAPGVLVSGNVVTGALHHGISVSGSGATMTGNVVSGSGAYGISAAHTDTDVSIEGNEVTNNAWGVFVSAYGATVTGNTVSGSSRAGMKFQGGGNTVSGNSVTGNGQDGVSPDWRAGVVLWGVNDSFSGNVVSGNAGDGLYLMGTATVVGGAGPGQANAITGNGGAGIFVPNPESGGAGQPSGLDFEPTDNTFSANSISGNAGLGIDLAPEGLTANDVLDADTGPNRRQNFPLLAGANTGNSVTITGTLNSRPESQFRIEFFANDACDASGQGEGQNYIGSQDVQTDIQGNAAIGAVLGLEETAGNFITATATNLGTDDTSEFSNCVEVDAPAGTPTPTPTPAPGTPTPTATPTPTPEPSATATPGGEAKSGDVDCDEDVDSVDALKVLRHVAGLEVSQEEPCSDIGTEVASLFGDVDCDDDVDSVDALRILRYVAGLPNGLPDGCPAVGA